MDTGTGAIPILLVTGFLGSGKTTLLRHLTQRYAKRRVAYLINEFSATDVDGKLVRESGGRAVELPGGSIFCKCLVTDFIREMRGIAQRWHSEQRPLEGVVVEASGISDPGVAAEMLRETRLDLLFHIGSIVTLVDPGTFGALAHTLPNIHAQVKAAELALINKSDLHSEAELHATERLVRELNPDIAIERTTHGRTERELLGATRARATEGELALCGDPNYVRLETPSGALLELAALERGLHELGEGVYRMKGFARGEGGGVLHVDYAAGRLETRETRIAVEHPSLVWIVAPRLEPAVRELMDQIGQRAPRA